MFAKVSQVAERMATNASRREFLGRFGRGAMAAAAALGGVLALPGPGEAARKPRYACPGTSQGSCIGLSEGDTCNGGLGFTGTCKRVRKGTACYCG